MKISLVICPIWNFEQPPLSISYIAGQLRANKHQVNCYDLSIELLLNLSEKDKKEINQKYLAQSWYDNFDYWKERLNLDVFVDKWSIRILENQPELIGFSIYDSTQHVSLLMAEVIKKKSPETLIVFGGPSCDNDELINYGNIDFMVIGEGEDTITELIERIENKSPLKECRGLIYLENNEIIKTEKRPFINNINTIPFPYFECFELDNYPTKTLPMFTSRGCPNRCTFCSESPRWGKFRYRRAENIVDEMERNIKKYGITHYNMEDSTINGNIFEFEKMCDILISKKLGVTWGGKARIDSRMNKYFLKKMYDAGCRGLIFGVESASQSVLNHMNKNVKVEDIERIIFDSYNAGIKIGCFFIVGYINEKEEDFMDTLKFIKRNYKYIDTIYPGTGLHILKGSKLYKNAEDFGITLPHLSENGQWYTKDLSNTANIRNERLKRFNELISELYSKKEEHV